MTSRKSFTQMTAGSVRSVVGDAKPAEQEQRESDRCGDHGCPLRADIFVDGRGSCSFHRIARASQKNPADVTSRVKANSEKVRTVERYASAPFKQEEDGTIRGVQKVVSSTENSRFVWVPLLYPAWLPILDGEHHHQWVDRARKELMRMIVNDAEGSLYAGAAQ